MTLQIGHTYKLRIDTVSNSITYTATILKIQEGFVDIKDKYGKILTFNINKIISYEELNQKEDEDCGNGKEY